MHFLTHVAPLLIRSLTTPFTFALMPVPLQDLPSKNPHLKARFQTEGRELELHEDDALRARKYMERHATEALTSDGNVAFTVIGNRLVECDPVAIGQPPRRLFVQFHPQTWAGKHGRLPCGDPEQVDVTETALGLPAVQLAAMRDGEQSAEVLIEPDDRGHFGPYAVVCESALCAFFGVQSVGEISDSVVDAAKAGAPDRPMAPGTEAGGDTVWMMGVGTEKVHFTCRATSIDKAIDQCREAFPGRPVESACSIA